MSLLLIFGQSEAAVAEDEATRAGYPKKKRKRLGPVVREPSPWEYSWQRYEREARLAFERLERAIPEARTLEPPTVEEATFAVDAEALRALSGALDVLAGEHTKRKARRALEAYRAELAAYQAEVAAYEAEQQRLAAEAAAFAEAKRARFAMLAADDEAVIVAYIERRKRVVAMAVAVLQQRYGETVH